jgi:hypothetical protein
LILSQIVFKVNTFGLKIAGKFLISCGYFDSDFSLKHKDKTAKIVHRAPLRVSARLLLVCAIEQFVSDVLTLWRGE